MKRLLIALALIAPTINIASAWQQNDPGRAAQFIVVPAMFGEACGLGSNEYTVLSAAVAQVSPAFGGMDAIQRVAQAQLASMAARSQARGEPFPFTWNDHDDAVAIGACKTLDDMVMSARRVIGE